MYFIYFEDKVITFTDSVDPSCDRVVEVAAGERISITKMLENLENSKRLCVKAPDAERALDDFKAEFIAVEAAGGLVADEAGGVLMILRNGRWDLPKGHVEARETPAEAAVREVEEETGLKNIRLGGLIATTLHFYNMRGSWEMKRTWWYAMRSTGGGESGSELTPQTEEGITGVEWIGPERLAECLEATYSSVREVFRAAGY